MYQYEFISVLTKPSSTGTLNLELVSIGASGGDPTLTISCTGIEAGESEITLARRIFDEIESTLTANNNQYLFDIPIFGYNFPPPPRWRAANTDHVISLFSQCQFKITLTTNDTGATVNISPTPILMTVQTATSMGPLVGQSWVDNNGNSYTETQIIDLLEMTCAEWVSVTNNYVVQACYVHSDEGRLENAIKLGKTPLVVVDLPRIMRPSLLATIITDFTTLNLISSYTINKQTGWIEYKFAQNILFNYEPFDMFNEIQVSYIAGYYTIDKQVVSALLRLSQLFQNYASTSGLKGFATGTFKVELKSNIESYKELFNNVRSYFLPINA